VTDFKLMSVHQEYLVPQDKTSIAISYMLNMHPRHATKTVSGKLQPHEVQLEHINLAFDAGYRECLQYSGPVDDGQDNG
jgi:hypothetical protein